MRFYDSGAIIAGGIVDHRIDLGAGDHEYSAGDLVRGAWGDTAVGKYRTGFEDSLECWNCTVRTDLKRFVWMQQHCPELATRLGEMMDLVYGTVTADYEKHIKPILDAAKRP